MSIFSDPIVIGGNNGGTTFPPIAKYAYASSSNAGYVNERDGWLGPFPNQYSYFMPLDSSDNRLDVDWSQSFEIGFSFVYSQSYTRSMALFGNETGGFFYTPSAELQNTNTADPGIWTGFSLNGSAWDKQISVWKSDGIDFSPGVALTVRVWYDGTDYNLSVYDGTNTSVKSITTEGSHYHSSSHKLSFGEVNRSTTLNARYVRFYLPDMYIKQNGTKIWGATT